MSPTEAPPTLPTAAPPPPFVGQQAGTKKKKQQDGMVAPTFLGTGPAPSTAGQKTLLGQ